MAVHYSRGRKHSQRLPRRVQPLNLRLDEQTRRIIYPRVAYTVAVWLRQQSARSSPRNKS